MSQQWQTSRWVRYYDWDWSTAPWPDVERPQADHRAELLPRRFAYHVLNVVRRVGDLDPSVISNDLALQFLPLEPVLVATLEAFRQPRPASHVLQLPDLVAKGGATEALRFFARLRDLGFVVPAGQEEPADARAIYLAANVLYGIHQTEADSVQAIQIVGEAKPGAFMEIGTAHGGSLFCWAQVAHPEAFLLSLDLPGGRWGGGYSGEQIPHFRQFLQPGQRLVGLLGDSHSPLVVQQVAEALDGRKLDVLFIDGDHTYEGAKEDFDNYSPHVRSGGLVLLHDIHDPEVYGGDPQVQVHRLWQELNEQYECEAIDGPDHPTFGVVRV
jgi:cephalosporin hydroxylase